MIGNKPIVDLQVLIVCIVLTIPTMGYTAKWPWDDWYTWHSDLATNNGVITYSIDRNGGFLHEYEDGVWLKTLGMEKGFATIVPEWETIIRQALEDWGGVLGVTFREVEDNGLNSGAIGAQGSIRITSLVFPEPLQFSAYAYYPTNTGKTEGDLKNSIYGDVFFAANMAGWDRNFFTLTMVHELGHALGLAHPEALFSLYPETVMSYADHILTSITAYDRACIQALYLSAEEVSTPVAGGVLENNSSSLSLVPQFIDNPGELKLSGTITTQGDRTAGIKGGEGLLSDSNYYFHGWNLNLLPQSEILTSGSFAAGIAAGTGNSISLEGNILTSGLFSDGILIYGSDTVLWTLEGSSIETNGDMAAGVAFRNFNSASGNRAFLAGDIFTKGWGSEGVYLYNQTGTVLSLIGSITTLSDYSPGIYARESSGTISIDGTVSSQGANSPGVWGTGDSVVVDVQGGIFTQGEESPALKLSADQIRLLISGDIHSSEASAVSLSPWFGNGDSQIFIFGNAAITGNIESLGENHVPQVVLGAIWNTGVDSWTLDPESEIFLQGAFTGQPWTGRVAAGICVLNGESNNFSSFIVDPGATLMGTTAFDGDLTNNGLISVGNSLGSMHVSGDYTQQGGLVMEVDQAAWDSLSVDGDVIFKPTAYIAIAPQAPLLSGNYDLFSVGGAVHNDSGGSLNALLSDTLILDYGLELEETNLLLTVERRSYALADRIFNHQEAGKALDDLVGAASGDLAQAMLALDTMTQTSRLSAGLEQISPVAYSSLVEPFFTMGRQAIEFNRQILDTNSEVEDDGWRFIGQLMQAQSRRYPANNLPGYQWEGHGVGLGLSRNFSEITAGIDLILLKNDLEQNDSLFQAKSDMVLMGIFAATDWRNYRFNLQAGWGWVQNDAEREIILIRCRPH